MKIGMLFFDPAHGVGEAVTAAANRYFSKYGVFADTVHVNPATIAQGEGAIAVIDVPVEIVSDHRILPGHYWIGNRDADKMPERIDIATA